jgi:hypothetical protein
MGELTAAYVTLGVGVVLLVLVVLAALAPLRRFTRANAAWRADVARRTGVLRTLNDARPNLRRPGAE